VLRNLPRSITRVPRVAIDEECSWSIHCSTFEIVEGAPITQVHFAMVMLMTDPYTGF